MHGFSFVEFFYPFAIIYHFHHRVKNTSNCPFFQGQWTGLLSGDTLSLSAGSIYGFISEFTEKSKDFIIQIEAELMNEKTACTDATVVTVNGKTAYIRNISSKRAVMYYVLESKSIQALNSIKFLNTFADNLEHDHETALYRYGTGHGECNYDFSVPFQNNMSEHDLRKCKNRQKMSGGFRKHSANNMLCSVLGVIETCKRKNLNTLLSIRSIFDESTVFP